MTRLIEFLISLAIVVAVFVGVGFLLPSSRHFEHSVETNRKMTIVYDTINSLRRFPAWNILVAKDPNMDLELVGPEEGVGARLEYSSEERGIGEGAWEIVETVPNESVTYAIEDPERGNNKRTTFHLEPTGRNNRNVKITQTYDVDYGMDLLGRYAGMYVSSSVGSDIKMSLTRLSNMLAAVPNYDYSLLSKDNPENAPRIEDRPAQNVLIVGAAVERNNEVVQRTMNNNMQWIEKVMKANNLVADGPVQIITNEFGSESYAFEVAQPVRPSGNDDGADEDAEGEATDGGDTQATAATGPLDVDLEGPVELVQREASKVAAVPFTGHMANLPTVRDGLRAWVLTRGMETTGRPYEAWNDGIEEGFTPEGEFTVYWSVR